MIEGEDTAGAQVHQRLLVENAEPRLEDDSPHPRGLVYPLGRKALVRDRVVEVLELRSAIAGLRR